MLRLYVTCEVGPLHLVSEAGYSWLFKPVSILVPKIINERPNKHNPTQPTESTPLRWTSDGAATGSRAARRLEGPRILHDATTRLLSCNLMLLQSVRGLNDDAGHQVYER